MMTRFSFLPSIRTPALLMAGLTVSSLALAQNGGGDSLTPHEAAPIDLTGYWVSVVSEDWRWRMVTPAVGDYPSIPITAAAKAQADQWDPDADEAAGVECRSFGAPAIMRVPGRVNFSWLDENTLQMEADAGTQTRVFHFDTTVGPGEPSWQGHSVATWEYAQGAGGLSSIGTQRLPPLRNGEVPEYGTLKVVTNNLLPGYLRKNGVPYSEDTVMTEYFDVHVSPAGERWMIVTTSVHDPENLQLDWLTSLNFKYEEDGRSNWSPTECSAHW